MLYIILPDKTIIIENGISLKFIIIKQIVLCINETELSIIWIML